MGIIQLNEITSNKTKNKRKITFNEQPQYFMIMTTPEEVNQNDNDIKNQCSLSTVKMEESSMDKNSNYIQSPEQPHNTINHNQTLPEDSKEEKDLEEESEEEDNDESLEIISDKVVLLMMNTGSVADKYTTAVRNMQEGKIKLELNVTLNKTKNILAHEFCRLISFILAINRHWKEFAGFRRRKEVDFIENTKNIDGLVTKVR